jgi:hypothetical protein
MNTYVFPGQPAPAAVEQPRLSAPEMVRKWNERYPVGTRVRVDHR